MAAAELRAVEAENAVDTLACNALDLPAKHPLREADEVVLEIVREEPVVIPHEAAERLLGGERAAKGLADEHECRRHALQLVVRERRRRKALRCLAQFERQGLTESAQTADFGT